MKLPTCTKCGRKMPDLCYNRPIICPDCIRHAQAVKGFDEVDERIRLQYDPKHTLILPFMKKRKGSEH